MRVVEVQRPVPTTHQGPAAVHRIGRSRGSYQTSSAANWPWAMRLNRSMAPVLRSAIQASAVDAIAAGSGRPKVRAGPAAKAQSAKLAQRAPGVGGCGIDQRLQRRLRRVHFPFSHRVVRSSQPSPRPPWLAPDDFFGIDVHSTQRAQRGSRPAKMKRRQPAPSVL